jgi:hypothetical protein
LRWEWPGGATTRLEILLIAARGLGFQGNSLISQPIRVRVIETTRTRCALSMC